MRRSIRVPALALSLVLLLLLAGVAASQEPVTDDEVNEIARQLYCPVCENTPLDVCPTQACQDWRQEIRTQLAQGKSRSEIEQYFVDRYGARVLAEPPRSGFNTIIWLLPIAAVVIGGVVFFRYLRDIRVARANGPDDDTVDVTQPAASAPPAADDDYISRVEKELRE